MNHGGLKLKFGVLEKLHTYKKKKNKKQQDKSR